MVLMIMIMFTWDKLYRSINKAVNEFSYGFEIIIPLFIQITEKAESNVLSLWYYSIVDIKYPKNKLAAARLGFFSSPMQRKQS